MTTFIYDQTHGQLSLWSQWHRSLNAIASRLTLRRETRNHSAAAQPHGLLQTSDVQALTVPQDSLSKHAWQLAKATQDPWLLQHAVRTFVWGSLVGKQAGLAPERPVLFAACLLHDVGLTNHAATPSDHCFAVRGARYAQSHLAAFATTEQNRKIADAISLHLDLTVSTEQGLEAHLLQAGAALDVVGKGLRRIPQDVQQEVLQRHPRLNMKHQLCNCLRTAAAEAPRSRTALYNRRFGFLELIQNAPFDEEDASQTKANLAPVR